MIVHATKGQMEAIDQRDRSDSLKPGTQVKAPLSNTQVLRRKASAQSKGRIFTGSRFFNCSPCHRFIMKGFQMQHAQKMVMIPEHLLQSMETEHRLTAPAQLTTLTRLD